MKKVSYSGVILDDQSHNQLVQFLKNLKDFGDWRVYCHHMTLSLGPLPEEYRNMLGQEIDLTVDGYGFSDMAVAVRIDTDLKVPGTLPHVTLAVELVDGKPVMSNKITNWNTIQPFKISGIVKEISF